MLIRILLGALLLFAFAFALGRAMDQQARYQERVLTTRHGTTIDCRVDRFEDGSIYLNDCKKVQVP